ncbi:MAG: protein phosphatase CheZ [Gallionella sp.]|jgi:chemotaxis protein CheZ|nr:protein phosphatase CheZ [Gallionella sp.]
MATQPAINDTEDLEALFDSILEANNAENKVESKAAVVPILPASVSGDGGGKVISQIGQMARTLHDTLRELGLNKDIEKAAASIPDARDRLNYVANLTQQAAERVLNAIDAAQPVVVQMESDAQHLSKQWDLLFEKKLDVEKFKNLVMQTHAFLRDTPKQTKQTNAYLLEIMMAQDFQDLTGQVIKKIISVTQEMEQQLLALLIENAAPSVKADLHSGLLNGPVVNAQGRTDIVTSQDQVDDLLESLGF